MTDEVAELYDDLARVMHQRNDAHALLAEAMPWLRAVESGALLSGQSRDDLRDLIARSQAVLPIEPRNAKQPPAGEGEGLRAEQDSAP